MQTRERTRCRRSTHSPSPPAAAQLSHADMTLVPNGGSFCWFTCCLLISVAAVDLFTTPLLSLPPSWTSACEFYGV